MTTKKPAKKPKKKPTLSPNGKRIGRPRRIAESVTVTLRVPVEIIDGVDSYVVDSARLHPGLTRSDVMRWFIAWALEERGLLNIGPSDADVTGEELERAIARQKRLKLWLGPE